MKPLSGKEFDQAYDNLPNELKAILESEKFNASLNTIIGNNHISGHRASGIRKIVAGMIFGVVHPEDLPKEIVHEAGLDQRLASSIADEIKIKLLLPVAKLLNETHGFHLQLPQTPTPTFTPRTEEANSVRINKPQEKSAVPETPELKQQVAPGPTPFVLHEHPTDQQVENATPKYEGGLVRPSFYATPGGEITHNETPRAHLELGVSDVEDEPQTTRVGKESARIVHYDAPEVSADPFSGATNISPQTKPTIDKKDVPPSNVVNLKDLPQ